MVAICQYCGVCLVVLLLAQLDFATAVRVKRVDLAGVELQAVLDEERRIKGDEEFDVIHYDDAVRQFMRDHPHYLASDAEPLLSMMEPMIEGQRSSPDRRTVTCDQATLFLWVATKWRIDAEWVAASANGDADDAEDREMVVASLVHCVGDFRLDSTCAAAFAAISAKCPKLSPETLLDERKAIFHEYDPSKHEAAEDASETNAEVTNDAVDDEEDVDSEDNENIEKPSETEVVASDVSAAPSFYDPCDADKKVHEVHTDKKHKCSAVPEKPGTCPSGANQYCYHGSMRQAKRRCCCREADLSVKSYMGRKVKKGHAKCASVFADIES